MEKQMNLNEFQELAMRTAKELPENLDALHVIAGLAGEVGELSDAIKKHHVYNQPIDLQNIAEELGDILWFTAYAANVYGMNLSDIAENCIGKLAMRYPEGYSDINAKARMDKDG